MANQLASAFSKDQQEMMYMIKRRVYYEKRNKSKNDRKVPLSILIRMIIKDIRNCNDDEPNLEKLSEVSTKI